MPVHPPLDFPRTRSLFGAILAAGLFLTAAAFSAEPAAPVRLGAGAALETLTVGKNTYQHVKVRSVSARTLMISHDGGMASIKLSELTPDLQAAFGYDPASAAAAEATLNQAPAKSPPPADKESPAKKNSRPSRDSAFERLLASFGQPPEIKPAVDLRPKFFDLSLGVKNQGVRPSCAVFAVVSALEFQNAQLNGQPERFSEEYLIWATRKTLNRAPRSPAVAAAEAGDTENLDEADEGFALSEVVTALRAYGIPLQSSLPYSFGSAGNIGEPPAAVIEEARNHRRVSVVRLPGRDEATCLSNLVQALNAGVPVAVGMRWPGWRTLRNPYLNTQPPLPGSGHAVTIVGYECKTGAIEDTVFIFKNSWGARWGAGGYGFATYRYLLNNLEETALLEVQPVANAEPRK